MLHHEDQRHKGAWKTELNQARSKPGAVDQPVKTDRTFVHHYNSKHYWNRDSYLYGRLPGGQNVLQ